MPVLVVGQLYHSPNTEVIAIMEDGEIAKFVADQRELIKSVSLKKHRYS